MAGVESALGPSGLVPSFLDQLIEMFRGGEGSSHVPGFFCGQWIDPSTRAKSKAWTRSRGAYTAGGAKMRHTSCFATGPPAISARDSGTRTLWLSRLNARLLKRLTAVVAVGPEVVACHADPDRLLAVADPKT